MWTSRTIYEQIQRCHVRHTTPALVLHMAGAVRQSAAFTLLDVYMTSVNISYSTVIKIQNSDYYSDNFDMLAVPDQSYLRLQP